jgi:hypothetical protein
MKFVYYHKEAFMGLYRKVYDFAAKVGSLEGYVYARDKNDIGPLTPWVDHAVRDYNALPYEVKQEFQDLCDGTVGRAIQSLLPYFGEEHEIIKKLKGLVINRMPSSPDDFKREK